MSAFDKYKSCKDCPDRVLGCHDTCDGYKFRCEEQKRINDCRRASMNFLTAHREQVSINYYKRKKKEKIYKR